VSIPDNIRQELVRLSSREATRRSEFSSKAPTKWHPEEAYDPKSGQPYTRFAAWERIHAELVGGCEITQIELDKPPGKAGYTFHFVDGRDKRIYVKLQIISGHVMGRSFHEG
jgi:hypothetical protein